MLLPARTGTGLAEFVTESSEASAICVLTDALLLAEFGSPVVEETESVWVIVVPEATFALTVTTKVKFAVVLAGIATVSVQVRVARTQVHPAGPVSDTEAVFAGSVSVKTGALAATGPPLVTLCV